MLTFNDFLSNNIYLVVYMVIYNISLISLFWVFFSIILTKAKTLYTFSYFSYNPFYIFLISCLLFSMAGVPPFIGFFTKLFVMLLIINNNFFIFYFLFFILLFVGLYFYIQNIRFLHNTNKRNLSLIFFLNDRKNIVFYYFSIYIIIVFLFGFIYIDDIIFIIS